MSVILSEMETEKERSNGLSNAEYKNEFILKPGFLKDELSNDVLTYGLHAWKENGEPHPGIEGFFRCKEPLKLTLKTLGGLGKITEQKIYMVENPAVFSRLVGKVSGSNYSVWKRATRSFRC